MFLVSTSVRTPSVTRAMGASAICSKLLAHPRPVRPSAIVLPQRIADPMYPRRALVRAAWLSVSSRDRLDLHGYFAGRPAAFSPVTFPASVSCRAGAFDDAVVADPWSWSAWRASLRDGSG